MEPLIDAVGQAHVAHPAPRIVSLVPSITELLVALGLADRLVGRTGFCIHPREVVKRIPKVGGTKDVKIERIRALAPTHVIVNVEENRREDVEALRAFVPSIVVTYPKQPADNFALFRLLGGLFGCIDAAHSLDIELAAAIGTTAEAALHLPHERVLYLIWKKPWMAVSTDTYIAATLAMLNWRCVPQQAEPRYPEVDLRAIECDRVLLSSEPYRFTERHCEEVASLAGLTPERVSLIDGEMTSWYGNRAIAGLRYLVEYRRARL